MVRASELIDVSPNYVIWQGYDPRVKVELFSSAIRIGAEAVVVDPISLTARARAQLCHCGRIAAVFLTNANHARAAKDFSSGPELLAPAQLKEEFPNLQALSDGSFWHGLNIIAIEGAAPGEFALYDVRGRGTLIIGDALINFEPHGFGFLPAKYCINCKWMIRSLRRLLDLPFASMFFAHGYPIVSGARDRLATLLAEQS
jgi:glyoxylase-like metal-dependent hydrolase (beta-lactamase superfamily II)